MRVWHFQRGSGVLTLTKLLHTTHTQTAGHAHECNQSFVTNTIANDSGSTVLSTHGTAAGVGK